MPFDDDCKYVYTNSYAVELFSTFADWIKRSQRLDRRDPGTCSDEASYEDMPSNRFVEKKIHYKQLPMIGRNRLEFGEAALVIHSFVYIPFSSWNDVLQHIESFGNWIKKILFWSRVRVDPGSKVFISCPCAVIFAIQPHEYEDLFVQDPSWFVNYEGSRFLHPTQFYLPFTRHCWPWIALLDWYFALFFMRFACMHSSRSSRRPLLTVVLILSQPSLVLLNLLTQKWSSNYETDFMRSSLISDYNLQFKAGSSIMEIRTWYTIAVWK